MKPFDGRGCQSVVAGRRDVDAAPILVLAGTNGRAGILRAVGKIVGEASNVPYALFQGGQAFGSSYWRGSGQCWGKDCQPGKRRREHGVKDGDYYTGCLCWTRGNFRKNLAWCWGVDGWSEEFGNADQNEAQISLFILVCWDSAMIFRPPEITIMRQNDDTQPWAFNHRRLILGIRTMILSLLRVAVVADLRNRTQKRRIQCHVRAMAQVSWVKRPVHIGLQDRRPLAPIYHGRPRNHEQVKSPQNHP